MLVYIIGFFIMAIIIGVVQSVVSGNSDTGEKVEQKKEKKSFDMEEFNKNYDMCTINESIFEHAERVRNLHDHDHRR